MEENMAQIELVGSCLAGMNWPIRGTGILAQFGSDRAPFYVRVFMLSKTICSEQHPTLALFNDSFEIDRTISFIPQAWNILPKSLRASESVQIFSSEYKKALMESVKNNRYYQINNSFNELYQIHI